MGCNCKHYRKPLKKKEENKEDKEKKNGEVLQNAGADLLSNSKEI